MPPVGQDRDRLPGLEQHQLQPGLAEALGVFPGALIQQHPQLAALGMHGQHAGGGLGGLDQIVDQLFELCRLPGQHFHVLLGPLVVQLLLLQQIHVVDDRGQGRLDVVGDVGDQLALKMLGLHALLHGGVHPVTDVVEILGVVFEFAEEIFRVHRITQVAAGDLLGPQAQLAHTPDQKQDGRAEDKDMEDPEHHALPIKYSKDQQLRQQERAQKQHPAPQHRQGTQAAAQQMSAVAQHPPAEVPEPGEQAVLPEAFLFHAHGKAHAPEQKQQPRAKQQHHAQRIAHDVAGQPEAEAESKDRTDARCDQQGKEIQGDAVDKALGDLLPAVPVSGGREQKEEEQHAQHKAQPRRRGQQDAIAVEPVDPADRLADLIRDRQLRQHIALGRQRVGVAPADQIRVGEEIEFLVGVVAEDVKHVSRRGRRRECRLRRGFGHLRLRRRFCRARRRGHLRLGGLRVFHADMLHVETRLDLLAALPAGLLPLVGGEELLPLRGEQGIAEIGIGQLRLGVALFVALRCVIEPADGQIFDGPLLRLLQIHAVRVRIREIGRAHGGEHADHHQHAQGDHGHKLGRKASAQFFHVDVPP